MNKDFPEVNIESIKGKIGRPPAEDKFRCSAVY